MSSQGEIKEEYKTIFLEESYDQLAEWEESLLSLEKTPSDKELIDSLFRAIHTLKGSAGFVQFDELQEINHDLESSLQDVRDGVTELTQEMIEVLFEGLDLSRKMIESFAEGKSFEGDTGILLKKLGALRAVSSGTTAGVEPGEEKEEEAELPLEEPEEKGLMQEGKLYEIDIFIDVSGKEAYLRSLLLQNRLEEVGDVILTEPSLEELRLGDDKFCYKLTLRTEGDEDSIKKALHVDRVEVKGIKEAAAKSLEEGTGKGGAAGEEGRRESATRAAKAEEVVRVPVDKLDTILNLVGELVVQNSGFISTTVQLRESYGKTPLILDLEAKTEGLAKIVHDLQDGVMKVRMLPVAAVFNRFNRVVRDLARDRQKEVRFEIFGEETEIDKKVMDRIGEPLVHLVRNAVDHGIEPMREREAFGKARAGLIRLGAYQEGDHICVEVTDDGRGLDREKIVGKAIERGLIKRGEEAQMSEEEILGCIFMPGFSTVEEVTDVSGRGVGLDVVKRAVQDMGGSVRIKSISGRGTSAVITLPLTMAIIPVILVAVAESVFAVPLSSVREIIKVGGSGLQTVGQSKVIRLREEVLSMVHLGEALGMGDGYSESDESGMPVVIVNYGEKKIGLGVDRLFGNEEIVIKSLSKHYKEIEGLIGASILGTGKIALIIDVEAMVRRYYYGDEASGSVSEGGLFGIQVQAKGTEGVVIEEKAVEERIKEMKEEEAIEEVEEEDEEAVFLFKFADNQKEVLEEIHNSGAIAASMALSQMTGQDIRVSFPETQLVHIGDVGEELGGEELPVGGIYVTVEGDISGGILIVLPMQQVLKFSDLLFRREAGTTAEAGEEEISGLTEMGNILSASFINAMADSTGLTVKPDVPEVSIDMCQSVIDSILIRFNQPGDQLLLTEAHIYYGDMERVMCHLLMFFEPGSMEELIGALEKGEDEPAGEENE